MVVIGITGKRCAGKNEASRYLNKRYRFSELDFTRHILAPLLKKGKLDITRNNLVQFAMKIREDEGTAGLVKRLVGRMDVKKDYVIPGIRFREEVEYLREKVGSGFILLSLESSDKCRWERSCKRNIKAEGRMNFNRFKKTESLPTEKVIPETMKMADYTINNDYDTVQELQEKLDKLMKEIGF